MLITVFPCSVFQITPDKVKYVNNSYKKVSAKMYDYNCDVKLKVGMETFKAHREILGDASDYFCAMFSHDMQEKEQRVIELQEISPQGFTSMMEYFYHGHVTVEPGKVEDIIEAARFFHIEWLIRVCCHFLIKHLSLDNYDAVMMLEDKYVLGEIHKEVFHFISTNFVTLVEENQINRLQFSLLQELLQDDHYISCNEAFILHAVWQWLTHDPENRAQYNVQLLSLIRYKLLEQEELEQIDPEILKIPEIKSLVDAAWEYLACPSAQCVHQSEMTEVRGAQDVLVLFSALDDLQQIHYKVPELPGFFSEQTDTSFMDSLFEFASTAMLGNFLFVAGGYNRRRFWSSPSLYRYNPRNRAWAQLSSMRQPRISFSLCAAERGLYAVAGIEHVVVDGMDREIILNTVEYYNPESNLWEAVPELPYGCFSPAACVTDEKLFVSGGISSDPEDNVPVGHLSVYLPGDKVWERKAPMLVERQGHGMVAMGNKLYVFGGYTAAGVDLMSFDNCYDSEMYDRETNQWSSLVSLPPEFKFYHNSLAVRGKDIYIIGGKDAMRSLHVFDTVSGEVKFVEMCGPYIQKVASMKAALPAELM